MSDLFSWSRSSAAVLREQKKIMAFLGYEIFSDKDAAFCLQIFF